tara:strand:+ start:690 stop:1595 length:906 start_codon:yes stop_codon:yes gene_type:complete
MRITITENQYSLLVEQSISKHLPSVNGLDADCLPTGDTFTHTNVYEGITNWKPITHRIKDVARSARLNYGDKDKNLKNGAISEIQRKLNRDGYNVAVDGMYGNELLIALKEEFDVDMCNQQDINIPIGPNGLGKLELWPPKSIKLDSDVESDDYRDVIMAATIAGECPRCNPEEIHAILSTMYWRADIKKVNIPKVTVICSQYNNWCGSDSNIQGYVDKVRKDGRLSQRILDLVQEFWTEQKYDNYVFTHYANPNRLDVKVDLEGGNRPVSKSYQEHYDENLQPVGAKHKFWYDKQFKTPL